MTDSIILFRSIPRDRMDNYDTIVTLIYVLPSLTFLCCSVGGGGGCGDGGGVLTW